MATESQNDDTEAVEGLSDDVRPIYGVRGYLDGGVFYPAGMFDDLIRRLLFVPMHRPYDAIRIERGTEHKTSEKPIDEFTAYTVEQYALKIVPPNGVAEQMVDDLRKGLRDE